MNCRDKSTSIFEKIQFMVDRIYTPVRKKYRVIFGKCQYCGWKITDEHMDYINGDDYRERNRP